MPVNPETIIGEILGERALKGADPAAKAFLCPFIASTCPKRSQKLGGTESYPVCTIWKGTPVAPAPETDLICVCPKRFYAIDFLADVIDHCWPGAAPSHPRIAPEVKMDGFGNVDFVIADIGNDGQIGQFLSVELQAIDITGSVFSAYQALQTGADLGRRPTYGLNWDNVYKRYITQLVRKGYFHHHWKTKIVAVIQEQVYRNIVERATFMRTADGGREGRRREYHFHDLPLRSRSRPPRPIQAGADYRRRDQPRQSFAGHPLQGCAHQGRLLRAHIHCYKTGGCGPLGCLTRQPLNTASIRFCSARP